MILSPRQLSAARTLAGMTQQELAEAAGVTVNTVRAMEQGKSNPRLSTVNALIQALRTKGVELLDEDARISMGVVLLKPEPVGT